MPDGRARWPSTESLAKVLNATGASLEAFTALVTGARALSHHRTLSQRRIPLIGLAQAGADGFFDDGGYPVGGSWDEVSLPEIGDMNAYALENLWGFDGARIPGRRHGHRFPSRPDPSWRPGCRPHDRRGGAGQAVDAALRPPVELKSLNPAHRDHSFDLKDVAWIHRIIWASH